MRRTPYHLGLLAALFLSFKAFVPDPVAEVQKPPAAEVPSLGRYAPRDSSDRLFENWRTRCLDDSIKHLVRGEKIYKARRYAEAVEQFRQAVAKSPDGVISNYFLGVAYETAGKYAEAIDPYKKVIAVNPDDNVVTTMITYRNLANVYAALGRADDAAAADEQVVKLFEAAKRATEIKDESAALDAGAKIHYNLGLSYAAAGRTEKARQAFSRAVEMEPGYAAAHYNLGVTYFAAGDREAAVAKVKTLKALDPKLAGRLRRLLR